MPVRYSKRHSSSVGCYNECHSGLENVEIAKKLLSSLLLYSPSCLHSSDFKLSYAKALLDRAKHLDKITIDTGNEVHNKKHHHQSLRGQFLLQPDKESGYTPLHSAILDRNLGSVLLLLRHAMDETNSGRLCQRPMEVLQATERLFDASVATKSTVNGCSSLILSMATASDNEGMTPSRLLAKLQQGDLQNCRTYLSAQKPSVEFIDRRSNIRRHRPSYDDGAGGGDESDENEDDTGTDFFSGNADLFSNDDGSSQNQQIVTKNLTYGCEVVTFGRSNHCALGVVSSSSNNDRNNAYPQRVDEFSQEAVGQLNTAVAIAAATHHTLVRTKQGQLYSFGLEGNCGRLGLGNDQIQQCPLPKRVLGPLQRRKVISIAAAENHSLCVTSNGDVFCFGSNRFGQLGDSSGNSTSMPGGCRSVPRRVEDLKKCPCVSVAAGEKHSVALSRKGEVYVWGDNSAGQLGVSRRSGIQKVQRVEALWSSSGPKVVVAIEASEQSTLALVGSSSSGMGTVNTIFEWGNGNHVPMKIHFDNRKEVRKSGNSQSRQFSSRINNVPNPIAVACARYHNAAICDDGSVYTWGLRAESLGRDSSFSSPKKAHQQRRNLTPQLVTGLLPENGGGFAVKVAASDSHTAIICDDGSLYTFGTTNENNVLGHEGVRWQPNPRRVPNVHRAVDVAVAKEHTVLLIGTSYQKLPKKAKLSSLENLVAIKIAEHVDLFNILPIMIMAERTQCRFLISYCSEFVQRNFDGVLNYAKKRDMNQYLNDLLAESTHLSGKRFRDDYHHPFVYDLIAGGSKSQPLFDTNSKFLPDNEDWVLGCKLMHETIEFQRFLGFVKGNETDLCTSKKIVSRRRRGSSFVEKNDDDMISPTKDPCQPLPIQQPSTEGELDRCIKKVARMDLSSIERAKESLTLLSKDTRSVRKKLKQIYNLNSMDGTLTMEQVAKVKRRPTLLAELDVYESAIKDVNKRITNLSEEASKQCVTKVESVHLKEDDVHENFKEKGTDNIKEAKSFFCKLCGVKCSDKESFFLHQNGRKHRNRMVQESEKEKERVANAIIQQNQMEQLKAPQLLKSPITKSNAKDQVWGNPPQTRYKLPPPPHPVVSHLILPASSVSRNASVERSVVTPKKKMVDLASSQSANFVAKSPPVCNFTAILKEQESLKKKASNSSSMMKRNSDPIKWTSVPGSNRCVPLSFYEKRNTGSQLINPAAQSTQKRASSVSIADFLTPPREKIKPQSKSTTSIGNSSSPWSKGSSTFVREKAKQRTASFENSGRSIVEIQAEEAALKANQDKSYDGTDGGSWYVERRERAESVLEIQKNAQEDLEYRRMVEEQMEIEAQIREENKKREQRKSSSGCNGKQNKSNGNSKRRNNQRRKRSSQSEKNESVKANTTPNAATKKNPNRSKNKDKKLPVPNATIV